MRLLNLVSYEIYFHFELEYFWLKFYQKCCRPYFLIVSLNCLSLVHDVYIHARFCCIFSDFTTAGFHSICFRSFVTCFADKRLTCRSNNFSDQDGKILNWCVHLGFWTLFLTTLLSLRTRLFPVNILPNVLQSILSYSHLHCLSVDLNVYIHDRFMLLFQWFHYGRVS